MCFLIKLGPLPCLQPLNACMCRTWRACSLKIGCIPASGSQGPEMELRFQNWGSWSRVRTQRSECVLRFWLGLKARALCFEWGSEPWLSLALQSLCPPLPLQAAFLGIQLLYCLPVLSSWDSSPLRLYDVSQSFLPSCPSPSPHGPTAVCPRALNQAASTPHALTGCVALQ